MGNFVKKQSIPKQPIPKRYMEYNINYTKKKIVYFYFTIFIALSMYCYLL